MIKRVNDILFKGETLAGLKSGYKAAIEANDIKKAEEFLVKLKTEDLKRIAIQAVTTMGSFVAFQWLVETVIVMGGQFVARSVVDKYLDKYKIPTQKGKLMYTREERITMLADREPDAFFNKMLAEGAIRTTGVSKETTRITIGDVAGVTVRVPLGILFSALLLKPGFARVIGAQTFSHGTRPENIKKILDKGLDPKFGAVSGGATRNIIQSPVYKYPLNSEIMSKRMMAEVSVAAVPFPPPLSDSLPRIFSENKIIDLPTNQYLNNAIGRTYVAKDSLGRAAAGTYALRYIDPETAGKIAPGFKKTIDEWSELGKGEFKGLLRPVKSITKHIILAPYNLGQAAMNLYSSDPEKGRVVAGVLPYEQFNKQFEADPDDITYGGSGQRTRRGQAPAENKLFSSNAHWMDDKEVDAYVDAVKAGIKPEELAAVAPDNLARGSVSYGQIWKNRTREMGNYLKSPQGRNRFLAGLGMLGGAGLIGRQMVYKPLKTVAQKATGKYQIERPKHEDEIIQGRLDKRNRILGVLGIKPKTLAQVKEERDELVKGGFRG